MWLLILALALYGYAGVLAQALGPLHWHSVASQPPAEAAARPLAPQAGFWQRALATLQDWHVRAQVAQHLLNDLQAAHEPAHAHHHGLFERHHHDAADASVVTLDATTQGSPDSNDLNTTAATAAMVALPRLLSPALSVPPPSARTTHWPHRASPAWHNAELARPERPPRV